MLCRANPRSLYAYVTPGLPVDHDPAPAGELTERDPVGLAVEYEVDAMVDQSLALQAVADTGLAEQVDGALLQHAGPNALLDVLAGAALQHDRFDALSGQE